MTGISERNPFVGPRSILPGEPLHGRASEVRDLFNLLQGRRIVLLHSPSGAGKSSLIHAGLGPRLRAANYDLWRPIRVNLDVTGLGPLPAGTNRYLLSAMLSLEEELPAERRRPPEVLAALGFREYLDGRPRRGNRADRSAVLVFDQFEEVLTVDPTAVEAKRAFFEAVGAALEGPTYWALFVVREDHLGALAPYRPYVPTQLANTFRLDLLGLDAARDAIVLPAQAAGRAFPAADRLVRDLATVQVQAPDGTFRAEAGLHVEPVQLQVVCRRLWAAMPDDDLQIDDDDVDRYARIGESLAGYYADAVASAAGGDLARERTIRDWVGTRLIVGGIRSQVRREAERSGGLENARIEPLREAYLVRAEQRAGALWFELAHDRMVEPVRTDNAAWEERNLHPLQVQAKLWEAQGRPESLLLGADAIAAAQGWAAANGARVTAGEREFLARSAEVREAEARVLAAERAAAARQRRLTVAAGAAAAVALVAAVGALGLFVQAREATARAEEQAERARAATASAEEQTRRAEQAGSRARDAAAMAAVRDAWPNSDKALGLLAEVSDPTTAREWRSFASRALDIEPVAATLDGMATERGGSRIRLTSPGLVVLGLGRELLAWNGHDPVRVHHALLVSPDGAWSATYQDIFPAGDTGSVLDLAAAGVERPVFSPDGTWVAAAGPGRLLAWRVGAWGAPVLDVQVPVPDRGRAGFASPDIVFVPLETGGVAAWTLGDTPVVGPALVAPGEMLVAAAAEQSAWVVRGPAGYEVRGLAGPLGPPLPYGVAGACGTAVGEPILSPRGDRVLWPGSRPGPEPFVWTVADGTCARLAPASATRPAGPASWLGPDWIVATKQGEPYPLHFVAPESGKAPKWTAGEDPPLAVSRGGLEAWGSPAGVFVAPPAKGRIEGGWWVPALGGEVREVAFLGESLVVTDATTVRRFTFERPAFGLTVAAAAKHFKPSASATGLTYPGEEEVPLPAAWTGHAPEATPACAPGEEVWNPPEANGRFHGCFVTDSHLRLRPNLSIAEYQAAIAERRPCLAVADRMAFLGEDQPTAIAAATARGCPADPPPASDAAATE